VTSLHPIYKVLKDNDLIF